MNLKNHIKHISGLYGARLFVFSLVGLVATFWQTAEKIQLLKYPTTPLSCNINPIVDCGVVLNHRLSSVFGVPNAMIGLVIFSIILTYAAARLLGMKPTRNSRKFIMIISSILLAFSVWFFAMSLYVIGKICIFCVAIWLASVPIFVYTLRELTLNRQAKNMKLQEAMDYVQTKPHILIAATYLIAVALFLIRFRDYYFR